MKTAIIHISDFHIKETDNLIYEKINKMVSALNVIGSVDKYIIIFTGDLAHSGKINEYKKANKITGFLYNKIKEISKDNMVDFYMVPGNHDMVLNESSRKCDDILKYYKNKIINQKLEDEIELFDNFYNESKIRMSSKKDKIIDKIIIESGKLRIQLNLINSAFFSTLEPNDKEIHFFPLDRIDSLDCLENLNITVMHHTYESYHESCKNALEKKIYESTDLLLTGHNHFSQTKTISINGQANLIESCGGEINFHDQFSQDKFNTIVIENDNLICEGYSFIWDGHKNMFFHEKILPATSLKRKGELYPIQSYIDELHDDLGNHGKDFTKYFIFPKLTRNNSSNYGDKEEIIDEDEFIKEILSKKMVYIYGKHNAGKTTLLKKLYIDFLEKYVPLKFDILPSMTYKANKFIKNIFEDQYGSDTVKYEKFLQLPKSKKIIFIDNIDLLLKRDHFNVNSFYNILKENFEYIVISTSIKNDNIEDILENELLNDYESNFYEINPFFIKKRSELVKNVCEANNIYNKREINKINNIVDKFIHNNSNLFSLTPSFLVKYIQYFTADNQYEYVKGENYFNKIFEYDLSEALLAGCQKSDLETYFTIYEEISYYMFKNKKDVLPIEDIRKIIETYNNEYGMKLKCDNVIEVGKKAKIIKLNEDYNIFFINKNHLAYFIAKRLFSITQNEGNYDDVHYVLKNICFSINSNIIMFYIYLSNSINVINKLYDYIKDILDDIESLDLDTLNIPFLKKKEVTEIELPSEQDREEAETNIEKAEQQVYETEELTALGIFDYDESESENFTNKINRSFTYLEMICKSIPSFYSKLKLDMKNKFKQAVYLYPEKLAYVGLVPINNSFEQICDWFMNRIEEEKTKDENLKKMSRENVEAFLQNYGIAITLSLFDHFAEMCSTSLTLDFMTSGEYKKSTNKLQRLMMLELEAPLEKFIKEAENMMKETNDLLIKHMVRLIVRKHLFSNKSLAYNDKQTIANKFFNNKYRKEYLLKDLNE